VDGLRGALNHGFAFGVTTDFVCLGLAALVLLAVGNYFFARIEV